MDRIDAATLLDRILRSAESLRLDDAQFSALSQLYFAEGAPVRFAQIEPLLSPSQMKTALRDALAAGGATSAEDGATIAAIVADSTALEIELSGRVAERLMKWTKIFGIFGAVPIAVIAAVLAWFGISSVSDAQKAAASAQQLLAAAKTQVASVAKLRGDVQAQLDQLRLASDANASDIQQLQCRTQSIEQSLGAATARLQSGHTDPGLVTHVDHRPGHPEPATLYGPFDLPAQAAGQVASASTAPWRGDFAGTKPGDAAFDAAWRATGQKYPLDFFDAQRKLMKQIYFDPTVAMILRHDQIDLTQHSQDLQDLVFAWASMAGPGDAIFHKAAEAMRANGMWHPNDPGFDAALLAQFYEALRGTRFYTESPQSFVLLLEAMKPPAQAADACK